MPDLADGESVEMKGSGAKPYELKNVGGVYSCTCPAWRNQSLTIEKRTCKHLRKLRGDAAESARIQSVLPAKPMKPDGAVESADLPLLLAHVWDGEQDPANWWMSEKLDGVRAYWDGQQFLSRKNNIFHAPDWFTAGLPGHALDGELWIARKQFDRTSGIVRRQDKPEIWKDVKYLIFDAPDVPGPFENRMKFLADVAASWQAKFAALHDHVICSGVEHLVAELDRVTGLGGEGLMLRKPGSEYERTRSITLLKVKKFLDDEAVVTGHEPGKGRHKGRLGAVWVRFGEAKEFRVGTGFSDRQRENPPPIGSIITVKYQELTRDGVARFPVYAGIRAELNFNKLGADALRSPHEKKRADAPSKPDPVPTSGGTTMAATPKRYFEFRDASSSKFWEVWLDGQDVTTRWGKIGTNGQEKTKTFADDAKAKKEYDKLLAEKTGKGYEEKPSPA